MLRFPGGQLVAQRRVGPQTPIVGGGKQASTLALSARRVGRRNGVRGRVGRPPLWRARHGAPNHKPRADWKEHQGPPSAHYALAKANGYDTKTMRKVVALRRLETHVRQEADALLETYRQALGLA